MAIALNGQRSIEWTSPKGTPSGFEPREVVFGKSDMAGIDPIEIAIAGWTAAEKRTSIRKVRPIGSPDTGGPQPEAHRRGYRRSADEMSWWSK